MTCVIKIRVGARSFLVPVTSAEVSACDPIHTCVFNSLWCRHIYIYIALKPKEGSQLYFSLWICAPSIIIKTIWHVWLKFPLKEYVFFCKLHKKWINKCEPMTCTWSFPVHAASFFFWGGGYNFEKFIGKEICLDLHIDFV